jgi:TrmH family RNA methyltransferase
MLGRHHPLLRRIRALRKDGRRRREEARFVAEGLHLAQEAIRSGARIEAFVYSPRLLATEPGRALVAEIRARGLEAHQTADSVLESLQDARSPQPVLAVVEVDAELVRRADRALESGSLVLVVEGIQDPGNLGSIVRSADAAGWEACCVVGSGADPFHPRTVRATMGSIFRLPVLSAETAPVVERLRAAGFVLVGADPHSGTPYDRADWSGRVALILGAEGLGLSGRARSRLGRTVRVPMRPGVESLSVAAAAAVLLFEAVRQRPPSPSPSPRPSRRA